MTPLLRVAAVVLLAVVTLALTDTQRGAAETGRHDLVGRQFEAVVTRVADGDTVDLRPVGASRPIRVRLEGVDAPEQGEAFGREALTLLRSLVLSQHVQVRGRDVDRYGRLVARLTRDGRDISAELVRAGLACHAYAYDAALAREEAAARNAGLGFWSATAQQPACVTQTAFSRRPQSRGVTPPSSNAPSAGAAPALPTAFRGNTSSRVYHAPHCRNYTCRNCTRVFSSHAEARAAGYRPAADCLE